MDSVRINTNSINGANLTVYNQNRALVKEEKEFVLEKGLNHIDWDNVPSTIDLRSINLKCSDNKNSVQVKEQNYQHGLENPNSIFKYFIGKTVYWKEHDTAGQIEEKSGTLLECANAHDCLIKTKDNYIINLDKQLEIKELPDNLFTEPKLSFVLNAQDSEKKNLLLSYEVNNFDWQCDYVLLLNDKQNNGDLAAWITLDNHCGSNFENTKLKLVAGDIHMNRPLPMAFAARGVLLAQAPSQTNEESFADYHLYTVPDLVNINSEETKRLALIEQNNLAITKSYIFEQQYDYSSRPRQKSPVHVKLKWQNDQVNKQPFPAGQIKVFQKDKSGEYQLIGEDRLNHIPSGGNVDIKIGEAFDITGERIHLSSERTGNRSRKETYKIILQNSLDRDVSITDIEHVPDLAQFKSDTRFTKMNANTYQSEVKVPGQSTIEITYTLEFVS